MTHKLYLEIAAEIKKWAEKYRDAKIAVTNHPDGMKSCRVTTGDYPKLSYEYERCYSMLDQASSILNAVELVDALHPQSEFLEFGKFHPWPDQSLLPKDVCDAMDICFKARDWQYKKQIASANTFFLTERGDAAKYSDKCSWIMTQMMNAEERLMESCGLPSSASWIEKNAENAAEEPSKIKS